MGLTRRPDVHGSNHFATERQMRQAGLLARAGLVIGQYGRFRRFYLWDGNRDENVLLVGPPRSGKGTGHLVPNGVLWPYSGVWFDVKDDLRRILSGTRAAMGQRVIGVDYTNRDSAHFNPLFTVRKHPDFEVGDVQVITHSLVSLDQADLPRDHHWRTTAAALLDGLLLHVLYAEADKSLAGVARLLSDPARSMTEVLMAMLTTKHLGDCPHPVVAEAARAMLNRSVNERSGVWSTAISNLSVFKDPVVATNTRSSDFTIHDLMHGAQPVSLFVNVPPGEMSRIRPVLKLFLNVMVRALTLTLDPHPPHRLALFLDEFPAYGRVHEIENALAYLPGYSVRTFIAVQSLTQLAQRYGEHHAFLDQCGIRIAFAQHDDRSAQRFSNLLGTTTVSRRTHSYSGNRFHWMLSQTSQAEHLSGRPLLTPGEILTLPATDQLVFIAGLAIRCQKIRYFEDKNFLERLRPAVEVPDTHPPAQPIGQAWLAEGVKQPDPALLAALAEAPEVLEDEPPPNLRQRFGDDPWGGFPLNA